MATTYSTSLNLAYIGTGDQSGTWGTTTNTNLALIEQAVTGVTNITLSGTSYTLVPLNGVSDVPRNMVLIFGGTPGGNATITAPLVQKFYVITNNTAYNIIMSASGGTISLTIPSGVTAQCYCDGTNGFYSAQTGSAGNFNINGNLNVTGNTTDVGNLSVSGTATLSGTSTAVTPTLGDNSTNIATTAFVTTAVNAATGSLGTMSTQNANSVTITGGSINGVSGSNPSMSVGGILSGGTIASNVTATTQSAGTNNTTVATTSFATTAIQALYPIGSIYTSTVSTNPNTLFGFGTWVAFGAGQVMIGNGSGFTAGSTGGSADAIVVSHTHTAASTSTVTDPGHLHTATPLGTSGPGSYAGAAYTTSYGTPNTGTAFTGITVATTTTNTSTGTSGTNANLQPYIVVYMWNRTA